MNEKDKVTCTKKDWYVPDNLHQKKTTGNSKIKEKQAGGTVD